jgi:hypothetical protein
MHSFFIIKLNYCGQHLFGPYINLKQALEIMIEYREVLLARVDIGKSPEDKYSIAVIEYTLEYGLDEESYWKPIVIKIEELHNEH